MCTKTKLFATLCAMLFICSMLVELHLWKFSNFTKLPMRRNRTLQVPDTTRILFWHPPYYLAKQYKKTGIMNVTINSERCGQCFVTNDKNALRESDVIVLSHGFVRANSFPSVRYPNQTYVYFSQESPNHMRHFLISVANKLENYDDAFNITVTHRRDSDVEFKYNCWNEELLSKAIAASSHRRSKLAIMVASNCRQPGAKLRKMYANALAEENLELERYGGCFGSRYDGNLHELLKQYKFYMAFENSMHCKDYITEKFWRSLTLGLIPVVLGPTKSDVKAVAPTNSYIHVEDFESPKHLAEYLNYLHKNDSAYQKYFEWRSMKPIYRDKCNAPSPRQVPGFCSLCKKLSGGFKGKPINITKWYYGDVPECVSTNISLILSRMKSLFGNGNEIYNLFEKTKF